MATQSPEKLLYSALETTGYKVYPQYAPQNEKNPMVIYNVSADTVEYGLKDVVDVKNVRFSVSIYADGYDEIKTMKENIYTAVYGITDGEVIIYSSSDSADADGRRIIIDLKIWAY